MRRFSFSLFSRLPAHEFRITFSTVLTLLRVICTPFIVSAMLWEYWGIAFFLFLTAAVTDALDGSCARFFNQKTFLGACLDPLADKFLLVSCFATLAWTNTLPFRVPYWFVLLVLLRELMIVFGFLVVYVTKTGIDVCPTRLGKATAALQMVFIAWLFACYFYGWAPSKTYYVSLFSLTALVIVSFIQYARIGLAAYKNGAMYQ